MTVFAAFMLVIVQVAAVAVPPVELQFRSMRHVEPVAAVAVRVTAVPSLRFADPVAVVG